MNKIEVIIDKQGLLCRDNLELSHSLTKCNPVIPANKSGPDPRYAYINMFTVTSKQDADTDKVPK